MTRIESQIGRLDASMRIVVVSGPDAFLKTKATRRLVEVLEDEFGGIDRFVIEGDTAQLSDVMDELRMDALFGNHKLVIVDAADAFLADDPGRRRALEAYAADPSPGTTLLLRAVTWRAGKLDKLVDTVGCRIKCDEVSDRDAVAWCRTEGSVRTGCRVEPAAAARLVERVGTGLARLDGELAKLACFVGEGGAITADAVDELVGTSRQERAWVLQEAILSGTPAVAWAQLRELLDVSRVPEQLCMWAISDLLRRLHAATRLLGRGVSEGEVRSRLRFFGPAGNRIIEVARRGDPLGLARLLERSVQTDAAGKSGLGQTARNLEALTLQVTDTIGHS